MGSHCEVVQATEGRFDRNAIQGQSQLVELRDAWRDPVLMVEPLAGRLRWQWLERV